MRRLGSGAMADVYLAEQESLARQVAVKVLRPETVRQATAVQRFAQEARAAAALVHGHIVQIHEVACIEGVHFLAEEYVAGPTLKAWLTVRGPLDARQAVAVLGQVGSALARAAEQGVVHRDIKPENLLVTPAGDVKVADFGLARVLTGPEGMDLTQEGMTLGTPLYMSPEQGQGRPVDTRSDLYSLGATVYHLMAGRPPFAGSSALAVVMAHVQEPLRPLAEVRPDLPVGLCRIVERLLAKDPDARFQSPRDLLQAVDELERLLVPAGRVAASPLAWSEEAGPLPGVAAWPRPMSAPTSAPRPSPQLHDATRHLLAATLEARSRRDLARRAWIATGIAAAAAFVVGLVVGRSRPRRSRLFESGR